MTEDSVDRYDESLTRNMCRITARAALTATGLTEAQLEGLANGTMVVVPVVPTEAMQGAGTTAWLSRAPRAKIAEITSDIYRAMLAAKEG